MADDLKPSETTCLLDSSDGDLKERDEKLTYLQLRSNMQKESSLGKHLRKSLQTCKVGNNLAKLEGLLKSTTSRSKLTIIEGLLFVLRQLLAQGRNSNKAIGFLTFEDAYGFYRGFFDSCPDESSFRDNLFHEEHGLCVLVCEVYNKRFVLLQSEHFSLGDFLLELEMLNNALVNSSTGQRFNLDSTSLNSILQSMDTEYGRMALKAVVFALHSRSETYNLGIKPDRAVQFLSKVISVSDECEKALEAAADIFHLRKRERIEKVHEKIQAIDHKVEKQSALLSEKRKCDMEGEKNALKERLDNLQSLQRNDNVSTRRKVQQVKTKDSSRSY